MQILFICIVDRRRTSLKFTLLAFHSMYTRHSFHVSWSCRCSTSLCLIIILLLCSKSNVNLYSRCSQTLLHHGGKKRRDGCRTLGLMPSCFHSEKIQAERTPTTVKTDFCSTTRRDFSVEGFVPHAPETTQVSNITGMRSNTFVVFKTIFSDSFFLYTCLWFNWYWLDCFY